MTRGAGTGATAHRREVKDLAVSKDVSLLLSASADCTLAVWAIDTDRQMTTMTGHRDEVCTVCCAMLLRALLCKSVCPSVCPSQGWISQKRSKLGSRNFHHTVASSL